MLVSHVLIGLINIGAGSNGSGVCSSKSDASNSFESAGISTNVKMNVCSSSGLL